MRSVGSGESGSSGPGLEFLLLEVWARERGLLFHSLPFSFSSVKWESNSSTFSPISGMLIQCVWGVGQEYPSSQVRFSYPSFVVLALCICLMFSFLTAGEKIELNSSDNGTLSALASTGLLSCFI